MVEIKHRWDPQRVLFSSTTATSIKDAVQEAVKSGAVLTGADLRHAVLRGADLRGAVLRGADLTGAVLTGAVLRHAVLTGAVLTGAVLRDAVLTGADLRDAVLTGAVLRDAVLTNLQSARLSIVPETGPFEGWKKCRNGVIVRLEIPADARRSNATGRKCRAEYARTLEVSGAEVGISIRPSDVVYRVGEIARCHEWCEDRWTECGGGIHFYLTRVEAEHHS